MRSMIPSGEQVLLRHGDHRAVVVEVGGGLRSYALGDWEVLDGYAPAESCSGARGQPLLPWPNRVRDGRYAFGGAEHQLPLTEPDRGNAIHGLVRWVNWTVAVRGPARVTLRYVLHPQQGWPFALELVLAYALGGDGLRVTTTATNLGDEPCPYGAGWHPYLSVGTDRIDAARLRAPGRHRAEADGQAIPVGDARPVEGTPYDFRAPRAIGDVRLDTAYRDLDRDPDGLARVELSGPDGRAVVLWMDAGYDHLMLYTGDNLTDPGRRRAGLAVEPMTCAPNALATGGDGLITLAPGASVSAAWGLSPRRAP
jgi:aldose 1-epimerase